MQDHPDRHYCLALVKSIKQFAFFFAKVSVIIFQDNKAKIDLDMPAVGQMFNMLQSINKPIRIVDYNFPAEFGQLLILSVYLMIKPNKTNDELRTECFIQDTQYDDMLKTNEEIQSV
ncbi:7395_t:CDS:2 [Cetraspora pellucida]|uniref:7395_t:CDS:1 n=1 Tax=Cetraspora pellucida TaxID=1433469 RepID=A0A9N9EGU8_9GLOM|nr:7395_t:CDS:2 [Cetraspora pellucida]